MPITRKYYQNLQFFFFLRQPYTSSHRSKDLCTPWATRLSHSSLHFTINSVLPDVWFPDGNEFFSLPHLACHYLAKSPENENEYEKSNSMHHFFKPWVTKHGGTSGEHTTVGHGGCTGENMHGHLIPKDSLGPSEKVISNVSFLFPFPWNFPAPINLTHLFTATPVIESSACYQLGGRLWGPGFYKGRPAHMLQLSYWGTEDTPAFSSRP